MTIHHAGFGAAVAALLLSACANEGSMKATPAAAPAPVVAAVGNQTPVGEIAYGGTYSVAPGGSVIIHGARQGCEAAPPLEAVNLTLAPTQGTLYDAGISSRRSGSCGKSVPVRAVGYRASDTFSGMDKIVFSGGAEVTITSQ